MQAKRDRILKSTIVETPLGSMMAIADETSLYLLEFIDQKGFERGLERLQQKAQARITSGVTPPIESIQRELALYFKGLLNEFKTPLCCLGTPFQKDVWIELQKIPYGETRSYLDIARSVGRPTAYRAVAQANASNRLAVIIPCHRVINAGGALGGYAGGLPKKTWLLNLEKEKE